MKGSAAFEIEDNNSFSNTIESNFDEYKSLDVCPGFSFGRKDSAGSQTYADSVSDYALKLTEFGKSGVMKAMLCSVIAAGALSFSPQQLPGFKYRVDKSPSATIGSEGINTDNWASFTTDVLEPANEQPRLAYAEVLTYAEKMGLPTDFPL